MELTEQLNAQNPGYFTPINGSLKALLNLKINLLLTVSSRDEEMPYLHIVKDNVVVRAYSILSENNQIEFDVKAGEWLRFDTKGFTIQSAVFTVSANSFSFEGPISESIHTIDFIKALESI